MRPWGKQVTLFGDAKGGLLTYAPVGHPFQDRPQCPLRPGSAPLGQIIPGRPQNAATRHREGWGALKRGRSQVFSVMVFSVAAHYQILPHACYRPARLAGNCTRRRASAHTTHRARRGPHAPQALTSAPGGLPGVDMPVSSGQVSLCASVVRFTPGIRSYHGPPDTHAMPGAPLRVRHERR